MPSFNGSDEHFLSWHRSYEHLWACNYNYNCFQILLGAESLGTERAWALKTEMRTPDLHFIGQKYSTKYSTADATGENQFQRILSYVRGLWFLALFPK